MNVINEKNPNGIRVLANVLYDENKQRTKEDLVKVVRNQKLLKEAEYDNKNNLKSAPETVTFDVGSSFDKQNNRFNYDGYSINLNKDKEYSLGKLYEVSHNRLFIMPNERQIKYESSSKNQITQELKEELKDDETYFNDSIDISLLMNRLHEEYFSPEKLIQINNYQMSDNLEITFKKIIDIYNESLYENEDKIKDIKYGSDRFEICFNEETRNKIFNELDTLDLQIATKKLEYGNVIRDTDISKFELLEGLEKNIKILQNDVIYRYENFGDKKIKKEIPYLKATFNEPFISSEDKDRFNKLNLKKINNIPFTKEESTEYTNIIKNFEEKVNESIRNLKSINKDDIKAGISSPHVELKVVTTKQKDAYRTLGRSNDYYSKLEAKGENYKVIIFNDEIRKIESSLTKFSRIENNQLIASSELEYDKNLDAVIEEESKNQQKYLQSLTNNIENTKNTLKNSINTNTLNANDLLFLTQDIINKNEDYNRFLLGINAHSGKLSIFENVDYATQEILIDILGEGYEHLTKNQIYDRLADSNNGYIAKYNNAKKALNNFEKERYIGNENTFSNNILSKKNEFEAYEVFVRTLRRNIECEEISVSNKEKSYLRQIAYAEDIIKINKKLEILNNLNEISEEEKERINEMINIIKNTDNKMITLKKVDAEELLNTCYEQLNPSIKLILDNIDKEVITVEDKKEFIGELFGNIDRRFDFDNFVEEFEHNKEIEIRKNENFGEELENDSINIYKNQYNQTFHHLDRMRKFEKLNELFKDSTKITEKISNNFYNKFTKDDLDKIKKKLNHDFELSNLVDVLTLRKSLQQDLDKVNKQINGDKTKNTLLFEEKEFISSKIKFLEDDILNGSFYSKQADNNSDFIFASNSKDSYIYKAIIDANKEINKIQSEIEKDVNEIRDKYQKKIDALEKRYTKASQFYKRDSKISLIEIDRDIEIKECMKEHNESLESIIDELSNLESNLKKTNEQSKEYSENIEALTQKGGQLYNNFMSLTDKIKNSSIDSKTNTPHKYEKKVASLISGIITPNGINDVNEAFNYLLKDKDSGSDFEHDKKYKNNYNYRLIVDEFKSFNSDELKEIKKSYKNLVDLKQKENIDFTSFKNSIASITRDNYENFHFVVADSERDKYLFNKLVNENLINGVNYKDKPLRDIKSEDDLYKVSSCFKEYKESNDENKDLFLYSKLYKIMEKNNPNANKQEINNRLTSLINTLTENKDIETNTINSSDFNLNINDSNVSDTLKSIVSQYNNQNEFLLCFELYDKNILLSSNNLDFNKDTFVDSVYRNSFVDFQELDLGNFKEYISSLNLTKENINNTEAPSQIILKYVKDNGFEKLDEFFDNLDSNVYKVLPENIKKQVDTIIDQSLSQIANDNISNIENNCVLNNNYVLSNKTNLNKILESNIDNVRYMPENIKEELVRDKEFGTKMINMYIENPNEIMLDNLNNLYDSDEKIEKLGELLKEIRKESIDSENSEFTLFDLEEKLGLSNKGNEENKDLNSENQEFKNENDLVKIDIMQVIQSDEENKLKISFYSKQEGEQKESIIENVSKDNENPNIYHMKLNINENEYVFNVNNSPILKSALDEQIEIQNNKNKEYDSGDKEL